MGRRASEGSMLSDKETQLNCRENMNSAMKSVAKSHFLGDPLHQVSHKSLEMPGYSYPNNAGCRLSLDAGRRESSASLSSSLPDGSKDSLSSSNSTSTLTGQDTDDSIILNRIRKSFQQKEEFLRRPSNPLECAPVQKEFYSRPKKLDKPIWPPVDIIKQTNRNKPTHQNFQRVKNDIENERGDIQQNYDSKRDDDDNATVKNGVWANASNLTKIQENSCVEYVESNGSSDQNSADDKR